MTKLSKISRALYLSLGLAAAGCASDGAGPDPGEAVARIEQNLDRLVDLEVFAVGEFVLDVPDEAMNCYGPCPGWEDEIAAAREVAAGRLEVLAADAEAACVYVAPAPADCEPAAIERNLAALRDLEIVGVGALLEVQPDNNPNCYNLPCAEDEERARQETCLRAGKLASIAAAVKK